MEDAATVIQPRQRVLRRIAVATLLACLGMQAAFSMRLLSATFDETTHLPSGYSYLTTGEVRLNPQHPPLIKLLAAAPLLALDPSIDLNDPGWQSEPPDEWGFGHRFLYGNDADRLLFWGRLPVVALALLMAFYVYRWSRELFGTAAGIVALVLCAFSPTVIAHARLVTFDVGLACFSTVALYHLWRHARSRGRRDLVMAGLGLGLALASKFSAVILVGVFVVLVASVSCIPDRVRRSLRVRRGLLALGAMFGLAALVVWSAYLFPADPAFYWKGLMQVNQDHDPDHAYFLMGQFSPGGFWYYFAFAFIFKTPVPTLIALLAATILIRRFRAPAWIDEAFLTVPVLAYALVTSAYADNLGVRYLLPVYPLLFVFAGRLARGLRGSRVVQAAAGLLALWYVGSAAWIYPDHLAYFNELVGGPSRGHLYLDDSNIDWGQDLKRLKRHMDGAGIREVRLRYSPHAAPAYYGIRATPVPDQEWMQPRSGVVYAFGTHLLIRGEQYAQEQGLATDWLSRYEPVGRVGYSIYLFEF